MFPAFCSKLSKNLSRFDKDFAWKTHFFKAFFFPLSAYQGFVLFQILDERERNKNFHKQNGNRTGLGTEMWTQWKKRQILKVQLKFNFKSSLNIELESRIYFQGKVLFGSVSQVPKSVLLKWNSKAQNKKKNPNLPSILSRNGTETQNKFKIETENNKKLKTNNSKLKKLLKFWNDIKNDSKLKRFGNGSKKRHKGLLSSNSKHRLVLLFSDIAPKKERSSH